MKQETLEEAFSKELKSKGLEFSSNLNPLDMFNLGAKWQSERMYSEEDMISFATFYYTHQGKATEYWGKDLFKIWFEQFKKK